MPDAIELPERIHGLGLDEETLRDLATMEMDPFWEAFATWVQVIPVVVVVWLAFTRWFPHARPLVAVVLLGAAATSLVEPLTDANALVWFAQIDQTTMLETWDMKTPWFILPSYIWFVGGQALYTLYRVERGATMRELWTLYAAWIATNIVLEAPSLAMGIYRYYGDQPFEIAGLPIWFQSINALTPMLVVAAIVAGRRLLRGPGLLAVLVLPPACHAAANASVGWPVWMALGSDAGYAATYPAAILAIATALVIVRLVIGRLATDAPQPAPAPTVVPHAVIAARDDGHAERVTVP